MRIILLICVSLLLSGCGVIKGHKNPVLDYSIKVMDEIYVEDSIVEEMIEEVIEDVTGFDLDLSPCSPEE